MLLFVLCFIFSHQVAYTKEEIEIPCNGTHEFKSDSEEVHLESPNKLPNTSNINSCRWILKTRFRNKLQVTFESFDIGTSSSRNCTVPNFLVIEDFGFRVKACIDRKPAINHLVFNGAVLGLYYLFTGSGPNRGFHLVITIQPVTCGGLVTSEEIKSLSMINVTKGSTMCAWEFIAKVGVTLKLTCSSINLLKSENCYKEALLVNIFGDDLFLENDKYCGKTSLQKTFSTKNKINIAYFTTTRSKKRGFRCTIIYLHKPVRSEKQIFKGCGKNKSLFPVHRVVGGVEAVPSIPVVGLWMETFQTFLCGGVLIHPQIVLTAAHCFLYHLLGFIYESPQIYVPTNEGIGTFYTVYGYRIHEHYHPLTNFNDIALIRIENKTNLNERDVACVAPRSFETLNTTVDVFGWGETLQVDRKPNLTLFYKVNLTGTPWEECQRWVWENAHGILTKRSFCAEAEKGKSPCFGDSGGPALIIHKNRLTVAGITSMGEESCLEPPSVFTDVSLFRQWIFKNWKQILKVKKNVKIIARG